MKTPAKDSKNTLRLTIRPVAKLTAQLTTQLLNSLTAFLFLILTFSATTWAETVVVFFEYRTSDGQIFSFEEGGKFYHAALKYQDGYIEARPYYGVHFEQDIKKMGAVAAVLRSPKTIPHLDQRVQKELGKRFELYSDWNDPDTTQCSKLVGQIIGVSPVKLSTGNISLSPDTLFRQLLHLGFKPCMSCLSSL